ncbi:hypothetical protein KKE60_05565 [Patescibacteria group bacterium]|nr:hypothetical protein [Patescibacteria group bacterium]
MMQTVWMVSSGGEEMRGYASNRAYENEEGLREVHVRVRVRGTRTLTCYAIEFEVL